MYRKNCLMENQNLFDLPLQYMQTLTHTHTFDSELNLRSLLMSLI